jgi:hypothetical protein
MGKKGIEPLTLRLSGAHSTSELFALTFLSFPFQILLRLIWLFSSSMLKQRPAGRKAFTTALLEHRDYCFFFS